MNWAEYVTLIAMVLVSGGVTAGLFQLVKRYIPESNNLRRLCAWILSIIIALAGCWLAGDVWGLIGTWRDGTLAAATVFTFGTGVWAAAEWLFRLWYRSETAES